MAKQRKNKREPARATGRCACGLYVVGVAECDSCLLARHGLSGHVTYDALDYLGMRELLPQDEVVRALREAEGRPKKGGCG